MKAFILYTPNGIATGWSMCGECGTVASPGNYDLSEKCCTCYDCGEPLPPNERVPYAVSGGKKALYHTACDRARRAKLDAEALEKAELVPDYDGPVYFEGLSGSYGDGYFQDVQELSEALDFEKDRPEFAFCCQEIGLKPLDVQDIVNMLVEEMDDDAGDRLDGEAELEAALIKFNEANRGVVSYYEDRKRKVRIPGFPQTKPEGSPDPAGGNA